MRRFLIVTADDFGLHPCVNEAVEQASRKGILTAASLMVSGPAAADAVRRAKALPHLKVGLHVVLADGRATLDPALIPALCDERGWLNDRMAVNGLRFFALPAARRQLEAEIRAQFEAFERTGLPLDHVNAHKHFHLHPTLLDLLVRVGRDFGVSAIRVPAEPWRLSAVHTTLLAPWLSLMKRRLRGAGIAFNDHSFGLTQSGNMNETALLGILADLPPGTTEIYLHPATVSGGEISTSMRNYRHAEELQALLSPRVRDAVIASGAQSGGFCDLPRAAASSAR